MRFAIFLSGAALAFAAPALAQNAPGRTPLPAPTPAPDALEAPANATPAAPASPMTQVTPATPATPATEAAPAAPGAPAAQATPATPAAPPVPIGPSVGATVYGAAGTPVGTISAMDAQFVTLKTDKGEVKLPAAGVGPGLKGPVIGLTAAQLDAAITQAQAARPGK